MAGQDSHAADDAGTNEELARSSKEFLTEIERIQGIELRKKVMPAWEEERIYLAREIEDATVGLVGLSRYQTRLVEMAHQHSVAAGGSARPPSDILVEWRAAERDLRDARLAMERAMDRADGLRNEHRRSVRGIAE